MLLTDVQPSPLFLRIENVLNDDGHLVAAPPMQLAYDRCKCMEKCRKINIFKG